MGHRDQTWISFPAGYGESKALGAGTPHQDTLLAFQTVPDQGHVMAGCQLGGLGSGTDEVVASFGGGRDLEVPRLGLANHHEAVDARAPGQRVGGTDGSVAGCQQADLHEGSTGVQVSSGLSSDLRIEIAAAAAIAATTRVNIRFTISVYCLCHDVPMRLEIDHVVMCVPDLSHNPLSLEAVAGGRHVGHGTANMIVPLGDSYIELVSVVDSAEASQSPFGSWVLERATGPGADAVCLRTDDIDQVAIALGLEVSAMSRVTPDVTRLSWRLAGLHRTIDAGHPFFIQWDDMSLHPGLSDINGGARIQSVAISGNLNGLEKSIGPIERVSFRGGPPSVEFELGGLRGMSAV